MFTPEELAYLDSQPLGRLATVQPDGTLQVSPVGFRVDPETATIEIGGFRMARSRKYRNVVANGRAAFVVDDIVSTDPWRVRCVEVRGSAEAVPDGPGRGALIRLHPRRVISFGIEQPDVDPHLLTPNSRTVNG